jgi:hypothetical protein
VSGTASAAKESAALRPMATAMPSVPAPPHESAKPEAAVAAIDHLNRRDIILFQSLDLDRRRR